MENQKVLVFDMDGTIADLYSVDNWLSDLRNENTRPYEIAKAMVDMNTTNFLLDILKSIGYKVVVTTWLSMNSSKEYEKQVSKTKKEWLDRMGFPYDEIHFQSYGTSKVKATEQYGTNQIIFDDNTDIRKDWTLGKAINPKTTKIEKVLADLICQY